jgi:sigma-B regulation protein RsbQ
MSASKRHNVRVFGKGSQPMLFAHGYGCDQVMWRLVTPAFENDYKIVLFDHVGHGRSDASQFDRSKYGTLDGYAEDVLEICRELDLADVIFVGHSVSAIIGMLAAIAEPERFAKLILIGPSPRYIDDGDYTGGFTHEDIEALLAFLDSDHPAWSSTMAPVIMGNPENPELSEELSDSFCRTDPAVARHFARVSFMSDNRADVPKVRTRSLVLQCSQDAIAPQSVGLYMHRHLPDSALMLLGATGHCPNLSAPEETVAAIKAFLHEGAAPRMAGG